MGIDIGKNTFHLIGMDARGAIALRQKLSRGQVEVRLANMPPCLIGMEACVGAHHLSRKLLALGHDVKLMPARYVKPYVKRNKNDAADAQAICEAVTRPTMRFVTVKSAEQQSVLMLHRTRHLLVRQRTMLVNAIRAHMAEFGIVARVGLPQVKELLAVIADQEDGRIPPLARTCLEGLAAQLMSLEREITAAERRIHAWHRSNEVSRRLETIPGIGPITASAMAASITDPSIFKSGRELAAWIGLVPKQNSTGGKERIGRISKQGDQYLRWLLVAGAMTIIRHAKRKGTTNLPWLAAIIARRPTKVAAVALANKIARIAWVLLTHGGTYQRPATGAA
ncbi:MAG: IS110 family transposase [Alphaproteobacteria bacterium]